MFLIVGLGNPGKEYAKTRHNVGFMVLDKIAQIRQCDTWRLDKKSNALLADCVKPRFTQSIVLAKPQTFMNNSGKAVKSLLPKLGLGKTKPSLVVVHDDIDISLGKVKVSKGSGSAGHKGVDSIIQSLGTKNFTRIRIGIQPAVGKPEGVENFVLQRFKGKERLFLQDAIQQTVTLLISLVG